MIIGLLSDVARQKTVLPAAVVRAIQALESIDLATQPSGRYEIEGDRLFYMVQDVVPRQIEESQAEAHRYHADIQIPLSAHERFGFSVPQAGLVASDDRLETDDIAFYPAPANECFMDVEPGTFVVFLPGELHRPCIAIDEPATFRKVVVKIHVSLLGL